MSTSSSTLSSSFLPSLSGLTATLKETRFPSPFRGQRAALRAEEGASGPRASAVPSPGAEPVVVADTPAAATGSRGAVAEIATPTAVVDARSHGGQSDAIVHVPASHYTNAVAGPSTNPSDTSASYVIVAPAHEPMSAVAFRSAVDMHNRGIATTRAEVSTIMTNIRNDPFVASVAALLAAVTSYLKDMQLNATVVAEDPLPHMKVFVRRLLQLLKQSLQKAIASPRFYTVVFVLAIIVQLARMGVFAAKGRRVEAPRTRSERINAGESATQSSVVSKEKASPQHISSPTTPSSRAPIVTPTSEYTAFEEESGLRSGQQTPPLNPLSDGTLANVASRFLALFTNSPAPAGFRGSGAAAGPPSPIGGHAVGEKEEIVVVNNGNYIETYRLTMNTSSVFEDPDRFVSTLIDSHVREERRRSPSQPSVPAANVEGNRE